MNRPMLIWIILMVLSGSCFFDQEYCHAWGEELTVSKLMNAEYRLKFGKIKLKNGLYENPIEGAHYNSTEWPAKFDFGDLNGDGISDAVAILWSFVGASGTWVELVAITNRRGHPRQAAVLSLGNKVDVRSVSIHSGLILLEIVRHSPSDPMCCPSVHFLEKYRLKGERLVLLEKERINVTRTED